MSKELWRGHGLSIALLDEHTFTVSDLKVVPEKDKDGQPNKSAGQERADNFTYHNRLHDVLENAANRCAKREAGTLKEYMDTYGKVAAELVAATKGQ